MDPWCCFSGESVLYQLAIVVAFPPNHFRRSCPTLVLRGSLWITRSAPWKATFFPSSSSPFLSKVSRWCGFFTLLLSTVRWVHFFVMAYVYIWRCSSGHNGLQTSFTYRRIDRGPIASITQLYGGTMPSSGSSVSDSWHWAKVDQFPSTSSGVLVGGKDFWKWNLLLVGNGRWWWWVVWKD